ncbi:MAG: cyclic nucleotide-binding domain-containing protein [Pyrinomonadaceae bacterium]
MPSNSEHTRSQTQQQQQQAHTLADIPLFRELGGDELAELNQMLDEVHYRAGEPVFYENDPGDAAYIVRSGAVRIWTYDQDAREVTLARLEPHEFFGELAVLDGSPRSANATAVEDTSLGRLSRERMQGFLLAHPRAALLMIQEIGKRLRQTNRIVTKRVTRNVNAEMEERLSFGDRVAERVAAFGGSWTFILIYCALLFGWLGLNALALTRLGAEGGANPDALHPYIFPNLLLSLTAALQAPIILMSLKRAQRKDRLASENDFRVNLKSELMLEELTRRMDRLQNEQFEELLTALRQAGQQIVPEHLLAARPAGGEARPQHGPGPT